MTVPPSPAVPIQAESPIGQDVARTLRLLRERVPLVHNITNLVVTSSTANVLLAIGASPCMVEAAEEAPGFAAVADALVVNLGTVTAETARSMRAAAAAAHGSGTPWVLDPVAVGALGFRSEVAVGLLAHRPQAIRGNASEILALEAMSSPEARETISSPEARETISSPEARETISSPEARETISSSEARGTISSPEARGTGSSPDGRHRVAAGRGVDSAHSAAAALDAARRLARRTGAIVTVSGAVDLVTDGARVVRIRNGHPMMTRVTGLGCGATAIIGACLAVTDPMAASVHGTVLLGLLGLAGELAAERARGPGSLQVELLDALYRLDDATLLTRALIEEGAAIGA